MGFIVLVDLAGISLDTDELVKNSKWIDLTADIKPKPDNLFYDHPIPSVLKKYGLLMRKPANPIYFQIFFMKKNVVIFDTINMGINYSASSPLILSKNPSSSHYGKYAQVLVPNGQILFIGGQVNDVDNLLIYDTINDTIDTWQIVNTTASDGRVIVFDGVLKPSVPALSHLSVLDTSKIPYEWSTPIVEILLELLVNTHH
uniref:Galactose oxidase n=1 Tax=Rhizophagus irregularis (strain DAOM 181602 / DAOM 197198 / MUCL 43194) TaxID=747089 RepID=U9T0N4_RHIID